MFHVMVYTCNDVNMGCLGGGGCSQKANIANKCFSANRTSEDKRQTVLNDTAFW